LGVQRQRNASRYEAQPACGRAFGRRGMMEDPMKRVVLSSGVLLLLFAAVAPLQAQSNQLLRGTEVHLRLLNHLSTNVTRSGDPFVAEVTDPVYLGSQIVLPAGARVRGTVGAVIYPRHFSIFRGEAAMSLVFESIEFDSRVFPAKMSVLDLESASSGDQAGKLRKDVKVDEGAVIQAKHDIKGDLLAGTIGVGGASVAGAVFSHVIRGFAFGMIGSTAYILSRKGKDVDLPAQTLMMIRMDNNLTLPAITADNQFVPAQLRPE
jgi:hypothetical protein